MDGHHLEAGFTTSQVGQTFNSCLQPFMECTVLMQGPGLRTASWRALLVVRYRPACASVNLSFIILAHLQDETTNPHTAIPESDTRNTSLPSQTSSKASQQIIQAPTSPDMAGCFNMCWRQGSSASKKHKHDVQASWYFQISAHMHCYYAASIKTTVTACVNSFRGVLNPDLYGQ